jgi:parallel beta-helix repeat protein
MSSRTAVAVSVLGIGLFAAGAGATDYYAAQKHPAANDANPGTLEKPFKTINAALPVLKPGDTLWVRDGVYRETVMLHKNAWEFQGEKWSAFRSGESEDRKIRFAAFPGEQPVIKGSEVVTGWKPYRPTIVVREDAVTASNAVGVPFTALQTNIWVIEGWTNNSHQVFCDGKLLQQVGGEMIKDLQVWWRGRVGDGLKDMKPGSFYCDLAGKVLYVWLEDGGDANTHTMEVSVRPFIFWIYGLNYIGVRGLRMTHANGSAVINWPAVVMNGSYDVMEDCEITWCDFCGVSVSGAFNTLVRCKVNHHGNSCFGAGGRGHRFIDCEFSYGNNRRFNSGWQGGGMKFNGYDIVFSGCSANDSLDAPGFWNDGECDNVTIENCRAMRNGGAGIMIEIGNRVTIRNNIVGENGRGIYISSSSHCQMLHNLCYRNGDAGVAAVGPDRINGWFFDDARTGYAPARGNIVWGNIFLDNCHPDFVPKEPDGRGEPWTTRAEVILPNPATASNDGNISDYNIYYRSDGRAVPFWYNWHEVQFKDLTEWQQKTGQDKHSTIAQPLFADAAKGDFHPVKGSPAIRFVRPIMGAGLDLGDARRDDRAYYTAGPYEAGPDLIPKRPVEPVTVKAPVPLALPADRLSVLKGGGTLATLAEALQEVEVKTLANGERGAVFGSIPFAMSKPMQAIVLDQKQGIVRIPVSRGVRRLYLLHALLDPTKGPGLAQGMVKILREDGMGIFLGWSLTGNNIAPSVGEWTGSLAGGLGAQREKTEVAWESKDKNVRLFLTTWENDNYWYPVRDLDWLITDPKAKIVILGVTVQPDK